MDFLKIKVADFEGPFDLLLHLIRKNKMNIKNVEIYKITNQYLNYLDELKEMDLEVTSEFIVVAATLIEIKSKTLLPKPKVIEEDEEDIEKKLLEKLILYKKIKESTVFFNNRYSNLGCIYTKKPEIIEEKASTVNNEDLFQNISLIDLYQIYNNLIELYFSKQNKVNVVQKKIQTDKYKIEEKYDYLIEKFKSSRTLEFNDIIIECECKMECVVTFLALLELIKQREVKIYQSQSFGDIFIERIEENDQL